MVVTSKHTTTALAVAALLLLIGLPLAAWFAGRASVHCPDTAAEQERADGELRRMMQVADSAHAETARWQYRYDSLWNVPRKPIKQHVDETRDRLHSLGFDALVDSLSAKPE